MSDYDDMIDSIVHQLHVLGEKPDMIRNTAVYQFTLRFKNGLVESGFDDALASEIATSMSVTFPHDFHIDYEEGFEKLIVCYVDVVTKMKEAIDKDYADSRGALINFTKELSIEFS